MLNTSGGSRHGSFAPLAAAWIARQTRSRRCTACRRAAHRGGDTASTTAFWTAGVEPTVADSPMPLAPSGFSGCRRLRVATPRSSAARPPTGSRSRRTFAVSGLPSSSYATPSHSACATPWAMPPCCWPSTSSGLTIRPQSSTATCRSSVDPARLGVDLDHRHVRAERERRALAGSRARAATADRPRRPCAHVRPRSQPPSGRRRRGTARRRTPRCRPRRPPAAGPRAPAPSTTRSAAPATALPPSWSDREPPVPCRVAPPRCRTARSATRSMRMPRRSATSIENEVACPWPCAEVPPGPSRCRPVDGDRAELAGPAPVISTYTPRPMPSCIAVATIASRRCSASSAS